MPTIIAYPLVIGSLLFRLWTLWAWLVLPPQWRAYSQPYVKVVELVERDSRFDPNTGVYTSTWMNAGAQLTRDQLTWYACTMVHEARHGEQVRFEIPVEGPAAEIDAIRPQRQCLVDMGAEQSQIEWLDYLVGEYAANRIDPSDPHDY